MITLYFSGTGNSKHISEQFSKIMQAACYSIEEAVDFETLIHREDTIAFCYPVYISKVPEIMRNFVQKHKAQLSGKKIIILCTQLFFSGDGARVFTEMIEDIDVQIIYAEHFNMPNNICNLWILPLSSSVKASKVIEKAERKLIKTCENIKKGIVIKRGFNNTSKLLGWYSQRIYSSQVEDKAKKDVRINQGCIHCGKCVRLCPTQNLKMVNHNIEQNGECTLCYRCVNACPAQAITVLIHAKVKKQYTFGPQNMQTTSRV
ncbi:MAG TPA: hypothetical protein DCS67_10325 [Clostridiales bacterium UBA8960]|nr:hypothetical protein [Clostridiales bacterium UBA8960]